MNKRFCAAAVWAPLALLAMGVCTPGCGGGGAAGLTPVPLTPAASTEPATESATGAASFSVAWPPATRLIPAAASSLVVRISRGATVLAERVITRPAPGQTNASVTFASLPVGTLNATVSAAPNADGTGIVLASGQVSFAVTAGTTTPITLTLATSVHHLEATPASLTVALGGSDTLTITAKNAAGDVVLTTPDTWTWTTSNASVASVIGVGDSALVQGVTQGTVTLTATETESGKSVSIPVLVQSGGVVMTIR